MTIDVTVPGRPVPQGSKRPMRTKSGRLIAIDSSGERLGRYRDRLAYAVLHEYPDLQPTDAPCAVVADFAFLRPASHMRKNGQLRKGKPLRHTSRPDVDKLVRALLDGLTGVVWQDDSQVYLLHAEKRYSLAGDATHIRIEVRDA